MTIDPYDPRYTKLTREFRQTGQRRQSVAIAKCSLCPFTQEMNASGNNKQMPVDQLEKKFRIKGWFITNKKLICPNCMRRSVSRPSIAPADKDPVILTVRGIRRDYVHDPTPEAAEAVCSALDSIDIMDKRVAVMKAHEAESKAHEAESKAKARKPRKVREPKVPPVHIPPASNEDTPPMASPELKIVKSPREDAPPPSLKITRQVMALLEERFQDNLGKYENDWSDARIANEIGTTEKVVIAIRVEAFGELKEDPEIKNLRLALERMSTEFMDIMARLNDEASKATETFLTKSGALEQRITALEGKRRG